MAEMVPLTRKVPWLVVLLGMIFVSTSTTYMYSGTGSERHSVGRPKATRLQAAAEDAPSPQAERSPARGMKLDEATCCLGGLAAGLTLGLLVGFAGALTPASAREGSDKEPAAEDQAVQQVVPVVAVTLEQQVVPVVSEDATQASGEVLN
eukprot:TRINITY_DN29147_c0_g1_i1.p1 TRINITY_DN29147_c0_g1~~TRINITY_DN29147_c0_g1_i1.p1  ORF type:complete len:150 (+),score=34.92 TRINITY_DN29147_c0_g1_i1:110-559(+)